MKKALIISCFNWYKKRLEPIRDILISKDYKVTIFIADYDHIKKAPISERYEECTYIHVPEYSSNLSIQRIRSHLKFGETVKEEIDKSKPDLIYLQMPPNNMARFCTAYKRRYPGTRLIIDLIDLWPESMPLGKLRNSFPAKKWCKWRNDAIKVADHVFTECDLYQKKLCDVIEPSKTSTLYLYKVQSEEERDEVLRIINYKEENPEEKMIKLAYLGSMNNILDIEGIVKIIKEMLASKKHVELHAIGDGEGRQAFENEVKATGCKAIFYGAIYDEMEKIRILAPCDFALNMMKDTSEVGLTIKSIDYMSYGLPLINNIKGDTWELVEKKGIGINIEDCNRYIKQINHREIMQFSERHFSKDAFVERTRISLEGVV